jgi:hypothetical protein
MQMRIGKRIERLSRGALVALALFAGASAADASTLTVSGYTPGEWVVIASGGARGPVQTAEFKVALDGEEGFSYCVDLAQNIGLGTSTGWDVLSPEANAGVVRAAWLVDRFQGELGSYGVGTRAGIAGLQIAIWETLADADGDLYGGAFALEYGGASTSAMGLARGFLGELSAADLASFATNASWAVNASRQDQLVFTNPIPEPSSILLFGFGGVLIAAAAARKFP